MNENTKKELMEKMNAVNKLNEVAAKEQNKAEEVEREYAAQKKRKEIIDHRHLTLQEQLGQIDKEIQSSNKQISELAAQMADMKGTMAKEKEELKRDKDLLTKELKFQEAMIKSLVPHSVEHVQSTMIEWDEKEEKWDLNEKKKSTPRFDKPFSLHGVKRPTAMSRRNICEYQNFFLLKKNVINFHLDKELNTRGIFMDDAFLQSQISLSTNQVDAAFLDPEKITTIYD